MNRNKILIGFIIVSLLVISGCAKAPSKYDSFAKCLTQNGATMFGTEWCSHCQNQKAAFGNSFQYISFVDCDKSKIACSSAGVSSYPTWIIGGKPYTGQQGFERLASLTECELTEDQI